jgi:hypothetical protein
LAGGSLKSLVGVRLTIEVDMGEDSDRMGGHELDQRDRFCASSMDSPER